ncbi:hypothetical protein LIER_20616 [Lithospermum erythrorhizon]|uniref:Uncharacterized protein n=1 Tax=Lithospermum erythrorhizon TaxID=34254 RepID=A0AAV3QM43_LITER
MARPYEETNEGEVSISGGMLVIRVEGPANQTLPTLPVETPRPIPQNADEEVARGLTKERNSIFLALRKVPRILI